MATNQPDSDAAVEAALQAMTAALQEHNAAHERLIRGELTGEEFAAADRKFAAAKKAFNQATKKSKRKG